MFIFKFCMGSENLFKFSFNSPAVGNVRVLKLLILLIFDLTCHAKAS